MSLDTCPFCEKPFKRLKSHLPHCKMAPEPMTSMATKKPKEILFTTCKHTSNKDKTNKVNTDSGSDQKSKSKKAEKERVDKHKKLSKNAAFALTSSASKALSTEVMNTDSLKPKTKWLAKREKELFKLQTAIKSPSVSLQEKNYNKTLPAPVKETHTSEKEIVSEQKQLVGTYLARQLPTNRITCSASDLLQRAARSPDRQDEQLIPMCKENANVSSQIQSIQKPFMKEYTLRSKDKDVGMPVFQTKTCVWDHIQYGLSKRRFDCVPVLFPIVSAHKVYLAKFVNTSESILKPYKGNDRNANIKIFPEQFPALQSIAQRPVQNMSAVPYSPDMATGYGGTFFISSHSDMSNKIASPKCQTSKPLPQSQELRLGDVKLNKLISWLGARTPKSPREAVTMFHKGKTQMYEANGNVCPLCRQWYYRKYIDVQKGGIGGISMLIGGYCVLSYIWSYPHIKKDRWRKYH